MKKNIRIISILVILGIGLGYLAYKTNIKEEEIILTIPPIPTIGSGLQNTGDILSGLQNSGTIGSREVNNDMYTYKSIRLKLAEGIRSYYKENKEYCSTQIGDINSLAKDIASYTGKTINTLTIKDACGKKRVFTSSINSKSNPFLDSKQAFPLKQENDTYIIYSLVDNKRILPYTEYPIIVYNKDTKTNTLLTIGYKLAEISYLDKEEYIIIKFINNEEGGGTSYVINLNTKGNQYTLKKYTIPYIDLCGNSIWDNDIFQVTFHKNFVGNVDENGIEYGACSSEETKDLVGLLTLSNLNSNSTTTTLGKFNKNNNISLTNEDMIEGTKNNTIIFHIDDAQYEINNNTLIKR